MIPCVEPKGESRRNPGFPFALPVFLLLLAMITGCATRGEIVGFKRDVRNIRSSLDTLDLNLQNLRMQVDGLQIRQDRLVEEMVTQSDLRQHRAYLGTRLDDIQAQEQMLSAQVNDLSQRLTGVAQRFDEMQYRKPATDVDTAAAEEIVPAEPRQLYDQAYMDLSRGNYELARMGFEEYLRLYPDTELADNALYWLGEVDYVQHNYTAALDRFLQVESRYPQGNKVAAALFKVGLSQMQLDQPESAKETLQRLVRQYPATPEAAQAQDRLNQMP